MSQRKLEIVKDFLGPYYKSNEEYLFWCPKCKHHKRKLSINFDKNVFKCWVCDYTGKDISRLVYSYGKSNNKYQWKEIAGSIDFSSLDVDKEKTIVKLPDEFITLTGKKIEPLSLEVRRYLKSRGLNRDDIVKWKIGYCPEGDYKERIIIPSFDNEGELSYFIARSYTPGGWQKYKNPPAEKDFIFNELYLDWRKDVVIVEGVFDAIVAGNAIPLLGSTLRENSYIFQKIVDNCDEIYIALDSDAKEKEFKISKLFMSYGVDVYRVDTSGFEDVGEMNKETFQARKKTADFLSLDNYLFEKLMF
jgi:DNA primase